MFVSKWVASRSIVVMGNFSPDGRFGTERPRTYVIRSEAQPFVGECGGLVEHHDSLVRSGADVLGYLRVRFPHSP